MSNAHEHHTLFRRSSGSAGERTSTNCPIQEQPQHLETKTMRLINPAPLALLVLMSAFAGPPAAAATASNVYVRIGDHGWTDQFLERPKRVHLGSTGGAKNLKWRRWGTAFAVGTGRSYSSNSGVAAKDRTGPATIRFSRRKRCYGRTLYTVVRIKAVGLNYRQNLGCDMGLHIGSKY